MTDKETTDAPEQDATHVEASAEATAKASASAEDISLDDDAFEQVIDDVLEDAEAPQGNSLEKKLHESEQRVLRIQADLENFRKRAVRDREDALKYATARLITDMLPVIDNLQRATQAHDADTPVEGLIEGVNMVVQQLNSVLSQHNCNVISPEGEFDPNVHEAILQQPSDEVPAGEIIMATQTGYKLHDRVIRPTQVIVSKGSEYCLLYTSPSPRDS